MIECPMITCIHNFEKQCQKEKICLKWRFAADLGKGNIVCMECLDMELMGDK